MKYKRALWVTVFCVFVLGIYLAAAQDTTPEPPIENECSPGGVLYREENQDGCPTEWHWKAGWYLAAVNNGDIPPEDMPDEFTSVLPPLEPTEPTPDLNEAPDELIEPAVGTCWSHISGGLGIEYIGPTNVLGNYQTYMTADCRYFLGVAGRQSLILAHNLSEAESICATLGTPNLTESFVSWVIDPPSDLYLCQVDPPTS